MHSEIETCIMGRAGQLGIEQSIRQSRQYLCTPQGRRSSAHSRKLMKTDDWSNPFVSGARVCVCVCVCERERERERDTFGSMQVIFAFKILAEQCNLRKLGS